jgi:hypothetical protein
MSTAGAVCHAREFFEVAALLPSLLQQQQQQRSTCLYQVSCWVSQLLMWHVVLIASHHALSVSRGAHMQSVCLQCSLFAERCIEAF